MTANHHSVPRCSARCVTTQNRAAGADLPGCAALSEPGCGCKKERQKSDTPADIAALRQRAVSFAQLAGMAEVASTALHNVGNVLNSVNVSASVVAQRLRESRLNNLSKIAALFREHQADLPQFLARDPKGRMLPAYLEQLAQHLQNEQADLIHEIEVLTRSLEHMKEIVAVQQSYARKCGVLEKILPTELVEDALRMNSAAFERHGVSIVREFASTPPLTVDKHKVLQILINLIRNAKYAMDERPTAQKVLTLQVCPASQHTLMFKVRDTGVGIAAENLSRVFEQGFTTKRDGHGLGLHSGLVAALEMGGKLTAESEGPGKGATFCLELPFEPRPINHEHARGTTSHFIGRSS